MTEAFEELFEATVFPAQDAPDEVRRLATKKASRVSDWVRALAANIKDTDQPERGVG